MLAPRVALLTCLMGVGGSSLALEDLNHQLAGLSLALPNPQAPTYKGGVSQCGGAGNLNRDPDLA